MSSSPYDLRDYFFDELGPRERVEVEAWLETSAQGRRELEELGLTRGSLLEATDVEPPRRIAFISDKVFEPTAWARFKSWFALDAPRLAFGGATLLAVLFAGAWATEPVVRWDANGFELAFGQPAATVDAAGPAAVQAPAPRLSEAQVRQVALALIEQARIEDRAEFVRVLDQRVGASEKKLGAEIDAVHQDATFGYRVLQSDLEKILNSAANMELAGL